MDIKKVFKPPTEDECWERLMDIKDIKEAVRRSFGNPEFLKQVFPLANLAAFDHEIVVSGFQESRNDYEETQYQLQRIIFEDFNAFLLALEHHIIFPYQFKEIYAIINDMAVEANAILECCVFHEGLGIYQVFTPERDLLGTMTRFEYQDYEKRKNTYDKILRYIVENADRYNVDY